MLYGILDLSLWGYVGITLLMTHITIICVTVYLHRCQAHRGLTLHPIVSHFFRLWLWLTTGMKTKAWVAIHRKHHARCETPDDPHSPQILGIKKVMWQGAELYRAEAKNQETLARYGDGTPNDWLENHLYTPHSQLGIGIMLIVDLILFGIPGITVWAIQMMWIPFWAAGVINGVAHYWGYRNFSCPDAARNLFPIAFFIGGEELHNNHHTFGSSAKFSVKWWEFDLGWFYIRVLSLLGLAKVRRVAPTPYFQPGKAQIDTDGVTAIIKHRFEVLAEYSRSVMTPLLHQAKGHVPEGNAFVKRVKAMMLREETAVNDEVARKDLSEIVAKDEALNLAYQYRLKLQAIWARTTASQKELVEALQEWCQQAEATGSAFLQDFAGYLKTYSLRV